MDAEIIACGSELLTPARQDTNSLWLTSQLNACGVEVTQKTIVGDDRARLASVVRAAIGRSSIVLITGGLGPTEDDVTRDAVAEALGRPLHFSDEALAMVARRFERMKRTMAEINKRQAWLIEGARMLDNPNGTAPGQWITTADGKVVALLPGPPREMRPMWESHCAPLLEAMLPPMHIATLWLRVAGMGESDLDQQIAPVYTQYTNPVTTILAKPGDVEIHLRARCATQAEAQALVDEVGPRIRELLGDRVYSDDGATLEAVAGRLLASRGATVATAESLTGGLLGKRITDVEGSSAWFVGGLVTYTDAMKSALLGVAAPLLAEHAAVSEPVAVAMAEGARTRTGATYALALTGYASASSGVAAESVGTVWIGLAGPEGTEARRLYLPADRERIRNISATTALDMLRRRLLRA